MDMSIANLTKMLKDDRTKRDSAFKLLVRLGYKYHNGEWVTLSEYLSKNDTVEPEWMEGFEDLVYSGYELQYGDYLILNKLSTPQILFLKNTIASSSSAFETEIRDYVKWTFVSGLIGYKGSKPRGAKEIFFNDLFITKQ